MEKIKFYSDRSHTEIGIPFHELNPITGVHWLNDSSTKSNSFHTRLKFYQYTDKICDADVCFLPYYWNIYSRSEYKVLANNFVNKCKKYMKPVYIWISGDYDYRIPFQDVNVILQGIEFQQKNVKKIVNNAEVEDPKKNYDNIKLIPKKIKPSVGFVGQVTSSRLISYFFKNLFLNIGSYFRFYREVPSPIIPHYLLRMVTLKLLETDFRINTSFMRRNKWLGKNVSDKQKKEYHDNIIKTAYTICIRGTGNFSYRFYHTISHGRIPVVIDTNVFLPFEESINWKKYCVWVPQTDLRHIGDYILEFHQRFSKEDFIRLQIKIRQIWVDYFSIQNYYIKLFELLNTNIEKK